MNKSSPAQGCDSGDWFANELTVFSWPVKLVCAKWFIEELTDLFASVLDLMSESLVLNSMTKSNVMHLSCCLNKNKIIINVNIRNRIEVVWKKSMFALCLS